MHEQAHAKTGTEKPHKKYKANSIIWTIAYKCYTIKYTVRFVAISVPCLQKIALRDGRKKNVYLFCVSVRMVKVNFNFNFPRRSFYSFSFGAATLVASNAVCICFISKLILIVTFVESQRYWLQQRYSSGSPAPLSFLNDKFYCSKRFRMANSLAKNTIAIEITSRINNLASTFKYILFPNPLFDFLEFQRYCAYRLSTILLFNDRNSLSSNWKFIAYSRKRYLFMLEYISKEIGYFIARESQVNFNFITYRCTSWKENIVSYLIFGGEDLNKKKNIS